MSRIVKNSSYEDTFILIQGLPKIVLLFISNSFVMVFVKHLFGAIKGTIKWPNFIIEEFKSEPRAIFSCVKPIRLSWSSYSPLLENPV